MTPDQARQLAQLYANAFPGPNWTPGAINLWAQDLVDLDEGKAGTTVMRLRRSFTPTAKQHHPSLPEFLAAYHKLDTTEHRPERCDTCDGTGWEPVLEPPAAFDTPKQPPTTAVRPCSCGNGRAVQQTFDSIRH